MIAVWCQSGNGGNDIDCDGNCDNDGGSGGVEVSRFDPGLNFGSLHFIFLSKKYIYNGLFSFFN